MFEHPVADVLFLITDEGNLSLSINIWGGGGGGRRKWERTSLPRSQQPRLKKRYKENSLLCVLKRSVDSARKFHFMAKSSLNDELLFPISTAGRPTSSHFAPITLYTCNCYKVQNGFSINFEMTIW